MLTSTGTAPLRRRLTIGLSAVAAAGLVGCSSAGTIAVENDGPAAVTVSFGDEDLGQVEPSGGAVVNTDDCLEGPIVVTFSSGRIVELGEKACPGQRLHVREEAAELVTRSDS